MRCRQGFRRFQHTIAMTLGLMAATACKTAGADDQSLLQGLEACGGDHVVEPQYVPASVLSDLSAPTGAHDAEASARVAGKTPVLIYIAVDTGEPFMKLAVDHELHALRDACQTQDAKVNWIAFVNSHLILTDGGAPAPVFMRCEAGKYSAAPLPPALTTRLELKRNLYSSGKKCTEGPNPLCLRISQPFAADKAAEFRDYPLAHPDIVLDLLEMSREIFSATKFTYFLHIKSHGSEDFLTTGLGPEQVAEKGKCQAGVVANLYKNHPELFTQTPAADGTTTTIAPPAPDSGAEPPTNASNGVGTGNANLGQVGLGQVGLGQVGLGQVGLGQVGLGQVGLGQVGLGQVGLGQVGLGQVGLGQVGLGQVGLGQVGLGQVGLGQVGLGQIGLGQVGLNAGGTGTGLGKVGGLGLGVAGLGATNHYGTQPLIGLLALRWFTTKGTGKEDLGFVYFESCESRASRLLIHQSMHCALPASQNPLTGEFNNVKHMLAYYSAAQSLWYRNLDWDVLFDKWRHGEASVPSFQKMMIDTTKLVPNYDFSKDDPLPLCHEGL